jgi:hypothetical protein
MKTTPVREIDRGPALNWLTDRALDILSFLSRKLYPYALMYEVTLEDDDEEENYEEGLHVCDKSCWDR